MLLKVNDYFKIILNSHSMYDTASVHTLTVFPLSAVSVKGFLSLSRLVSLLALRLKLAQACAVRPRCAQGMDGAQDAPLGFGADCGGIGVERVKGGDLFVEAAPRRGADARLKIAIGFSGQQNTPPFHSGFSQGCGAGCCPPWRA